MADATLPPTAAVPALPAFGVAADARLQQLVRGQPEEVGDAVQILQPERAVRVAEDFRDPAFGFIEAPERQFLAGLTAGAQKRVNVLFQQQVGPEHTVKW